MARTLLQDGQTVVVTEEELGLEAPDPDVRYTLRMISLEDMKAIRLKNTPKAPNRRSGRMESGETDPIGFGFDCFETCLVDWSGIVVDGKPAPCNRETKLLLARNLPLVTAITRRCGFGEGQEGQEDSFRGPA